MIDHDEILEPETGAEAVEDAGALTETVEGWESEADETEASAEKPAAAPRRFGFYLSPKQAFIGIAVVLFGVLGALLLYLFWLTAPADFTREGGKTQAGLQPIFASYGPGTGKSPKFSGPMGAAFSPDGERIYVADTGNNRIVVLDADGKFIREFGSLGVAKPLQGSARTWDPGELSYPTDVAVDEDGHVYVADFYNDSISVFTAEGKFLRRLPDPYAIAGKGGSGADGGGIAVTAVTVRDGLVYATDTYQIFVFTTKGEFVRQFGKPGTGPSDLDHPGGIAVDTSGRIYVSDSNHNRVIAFTPDGKTIWVSGRPVSDLQAETENTFVLPRGLAVLKDGTMLVADPLNQQITHIDENGKKVAVYGSRGTEAGQVNFPNDVSVQGGRIVLADRQNDRIQVVRLKR